MRNVITAGCTSALRFDCPNHFHDTWELVYYVSGSGILHHNVDQTPFSTGDFVLIPPNIRHYEETVIGYSTYIILFSEADFAPSSVTFYRDKNQTIFSLVKKLYHEFYTKQPNRLNICEGLLNLINQYIVSYDGGRFEKNYSPFVSVFINRLVESFSDSDFLLKNAMDNVPYSEDYFRKLFKKETGKNPIRYLFDLRIGFARKLLEKSTLSVKRIAYMSGYSDPGYFSRQFKLLTGKYPREWRLESEQKKTISPVLPSDETEYAIEDNYNKVTVGIHH